MRPKMDDPSVSTYPAQRPRDISTTPPHAPRRPEQSTDTTPLGYLPPKRAAHRSPPRNGRRGEGVHAAPNPSYCRRRFLSRRSIHGRAEVLRRARARARRHRPRRRVHRHRALQAPPRPQHPHRRKEPGERSIFGI
uniref:Uncharacterized protein n=1 Tax=Leersia perrieri TaxID=77586 RepID=A0A0D9XWR3_9ORYZ